MNTIRAKRSGTRGKISSSKLLSTSALTAAGLLAFAMNPARAEDVPAPEAPAPEAAAPWTGFETETGSATFETPSSTMTNITQNSALYVGTSRNLDIPEGYHVNIDQASPNWLFAAKAAPDADPTYILGRLSADGRVIIIDRNGVFFGGPSEIDVAGIVATTGDLTIDQLENKQFGDYQINNITSGRIDLNGTVTVADAGLAAFVAPTVTNSGVINAKMGKVALASGETVTLDLYGDKLVEIAVKGDVADALVENSGAINANGGVVQISAKQAKSAVDNIINVSGVIDVSSATQVGGKIILDGGNAGKVSVKSAVKANGTSGGQIQVAGHAVVLEESSVLSADAGENGNGGQIGVYGNSFAIMGGQASARGGASGGNGGFVELSAGEGVGFLGLVDTSAANGATGKFMIDPERINLGDFPALTTVADVALDVILGGGLSVLRIDDGALANTLRFSDVDLWATEEIFTSSDFDISTWSGLFSSGITTNDLSLSAKEININHNITLGTGQLNLVDTVAGFSPLGFGLLPAPTDIDLETVNLNAKILTRSSVGGATSVAGDAQINSVSGVINVLSNNALIQQAIHLADFSGDKIINVAQDTYTENLLINKNNLKLDGANATLRYENANSGSGTAGNLVTVTADNVNIDPFVFDGLGIANYGINATGADNLIVDGNTFQNFLLTNVNVTNSSGVRIFGNTMTGAQKGVHANNTPDIWVYSNTINNATVAGVHVANTNGTDYFNDIDIWNNNINSAASANGVVVENSSFATIGAHLTNQPDTDDVNNGNNITGGINGVVVVNSSDAMVRYNHISGTSADGVEVNGGARVNVWDNTISNIGWDGIQFNTSTDGQIKNNSITNVTGASGIAVMGGSHNTLIDNNDINGVDRLGIYVWNSNGLNITGNDINDTGREGGNNWFLSGVHLENSSNSTIQGNLIRNTGGDAIHVGGAGNAAAVTTTGNSILNNVIGYTDLTATTLAGANNVNGDGILVNGTNDAIIKGNKIGQTTGPGAIEVLNANGAIVGGPGVGEGNVIRNSANDGVRMENNSNITVEANDIDGTGRVNIWGGNINTALIKNNKVAHDGLANYGSIHADGGSNWTVSGNTVGNKFPDNNSAGDIGIFLNGVGGMNAITGNTVDSTSSDGIRTQNTGNLTISGNEVGNGSFIGGDGIRVDNSVGVQITNNNSFNAAKNGIIVTDGDNAMISDNQVEGADQDGIAIVSSDDVQILNNDLGLLAIVFGQPNVGDSISITSSDDATISGNEIRNAGTNGIHLDGATDVTITSNEILDSAQIGLLVENGSTVAALTGNTFNGTPTYIKNTVAGTDIYAGNNTFSSLIAHPGYNPSVDAFDINALFELEDKTDHIMDNDAYGKVTYIDGHVFVTGNTLGIQQGVDVADVNDTVHVNNATYTENVLIDKNGLKLIGYGTTVQYDTANDGPGRSPAGSVFTVTADGVNIDPFAFDGLNIANYGINASGADNLVVDGNSFVNFVDTNVNIDSSSSVRIFGNTMTGAQKGVHANNSPDVWVYSNDINGATVAGVHISNTNGTDYFSDADVWNNNINSGANATGVLVENSNFATIGAHLTNQPDPDDVNNGNNITGGINGVVVVNSSDAMVRYNHISGTSADGVEVNGGARVNVWDNTISNIGWDGIQFNASTNGQIKNNSITNVTGASGIATMFGSNGTLIEGNTINGADRLGIYVWNSDNLQIKNNTITDTGREGGPNWFLSAIHLEGAGNTTVDGNIIDNSNGSGIRVGGVGNQAAQTTSGNVIKNNKIKNVDQDGISVRDSNGVQITSNAVGYEADGTTSAGVNNIKGDGIFVWNSDGALINKNKVTETHSTAFDKGSSIQVLNSDNVTIGGAAVADGNTLTNSGWDYIRVDAEGGTVNSFLIANNTGSGDAERVGIYTEGLTNSVIDANKISETNRYGGIYTNGGNNLTIKNNIVKNIDEVGILMIGTTGTNLVDKNTVFNTGIDKKAADGSNSGDGIQVRNSGGTNVASTTISNNSVGYTTLAHAASAGANNIKGDGISVYDSNYSNVTGNFIIDTTGNGIFIDPSNFSNIISNTINNAGQNGIYSLNNSDVKIQKNKIKVAGQNGILVVGGNNVLVGGPAGSDADGNTVEDTILDGIHAENTTALTIQKNTVFNNNDDGIDVTNTASVQILSNKVGKNSPASADVSDNGIEVTNSASANVSSNTITNVGNNGIQIDPSPNSTIYGNTISNAVHNGIYSLDNDNITIGGFGAGQRNTISDVGDNGILVVSSNNNTHKNNNATIQNNKITNAGIDGIQVKYGKDVIVDGNLIQGGNGSFTIFPPAAVNGKNGAGRDGIHLENSHNAIIKNNQILGGSGAGLGSGVGGKGAVNDGIFVKDSDSTQILNNLVQAGLTVPFIGGKGGVGAGNNGIEVLNGKFVLIDNNTVKGTDTGNAQGAVNDGIHVVGNQEARITNNKITGGLLAGSEGAGHDGIFVDNSGSKTSGFFNLNARDGVVVTGNIISTNGLSRSAGHDGIHVYNSGSGVFGDAALVANNTVLRAGNDGIFVDKTTGVNVLTNSVTLSGDEGIEVDNSDLAKILNNTVTLSGDVGILVDPSSFTLTDGNNVSLSGSHGIQVIGGISNTVSNNTVSISGGDGVRIDNNSASKVVHNTITLSGSDGVEINGGLVGNVVDNNTITISSAHGVNFHDSNLGKIINNTISISGIDGINANNVQGLTVDHNNVSISGDDGIEITNGNLVSITNNTVTLSTDDGITTTGVNALDISNNNVSLSLTGDGIDVNGSTIFGIENNTVTLSADNGIELSDANIGTVDGNTVSLSGADGIYGNNLNLTGIVNNNVSLSVDDGIDVDGALLSSINGNTVTLSLTGNGIEASAFNAGQINGNHVSLSLLGNGIDLRDSTLVEISGNDVTSSGQNGIFVDPSFLIDVSGNVVTLSGTDGIHIEDVIGLTVNNNNVSLSGDDGIDVDGVALYTIDDNIVTGQLDNGIELSNALFGEVNGNTVSLSIFGDGINTQNTLFTDIIGNTVLLSGDDGIDTDNSLFQNIVGNVVTLSLNNGIEVSDDLFGNIAGNFVTLSGNDGIHLDGGLFTDILGNVVALSGDDGIDVDNTLFADVNNNLVLFSFNNGIEVSDSLFVDVQDNTVLFSGNDGINVDNSAFADVTNNFVMFAFGDGIDVDDSFVADINDNNVLFVLGDGIEVTDSAFVDINGNNVLFTGDDGIDVRNSFGADINNNNILFTLGDGIQVRDSNFVDIDDNFIRFAGDDGIDLESSFGTEITDNDIRFVNNSGVEIENSNNILVDNNIIANAAVGILIDPSSDIFVLNNKISNTDIGLYAQGPDNGYIEVTGNTFTDNRVGARFESGIIDLTKISSDPGFGGFGNKFIGGETAIEFAAYKGDTLQLSLVKAGGGHTHDTTFSYETFPTTPTNPLNFGGTIGNQYFEGQSVAFVTLDRGTFVDPISGEAIWLDATDSTYFRPGFGAFSPADTLDVLDAGQLAFLESMFFHLPDAGNRGIFWFGAVPDETTLSILKDPIYAPYDAGVSGLNVTITGLPRLSGGAPAGSPGISGLNQIAPAAGDEAGAQGNVADIEPAAGGDEQPASQSASCWGDAVNAAGAGSAVTYSYGGTFEESVAAAANCNTASLF